ncbi:MAG: adenine deaminase [Bacteroidota bacterium]
MKSFEISGQIVDVVKKRIYPGKVFITNGFISKIEETDNVDNQYLIPGLIDSHIHIESSMLIPSEFARIAVLHGTVATVSDPHEIGNVLGMKGIEFMISNGKKVPFKFYFGAPSCVPATSFETTGADLGIEETAKLLEMEDIYGLAEMMNVPGVLFKDPEVMKKLELAKRKGKPIDGHAPGLVGIDAQKYIGAGISTDHECVTIGEAREKINFGMKVLIREGSAARDFEALSDLILEFPEMVMFCSDDKHPNELVEGHINLLVKRAIAKGFDPINVLRCATLNPKTHYNLSVGLLQEGDPADMVVVNDLEEFIVMKTFVNGNLVAINGETLIPSLVELPVNTFIASPLSVDDIRVKAIGENIRVIKAIDGQLVTEEMIVPATLSEGFVNGSTKNDILKLIVKNRFTDAPAAVGFIHGFGIRDGAIASSVAHDSHNVIGVGDHDEALLEAMNLVIASGGGIACVGNLGTHFLPLPYAGIMTDEDGFEVAGEYKILDQMAKNMGSCLTAPFMTLSFMALLVIPDLKLSDKGLFNGREFHFTDLFFTP